MPKVRFLVTRTVQDGTGTTYEAGKTYEMSDASAERWIRRKVAELAGPASKTTKPMETMTMKPNETTVSSAESKVLRPAGKAPKTRTEK